MKLPPQTPSIERRPEALAQQMTASSDAGGVEPSLRPQDLYRLPAGLARMALALGH